MNSAIRHVDAGPCGANRRGFGRVIRWATAAGMYAYVIVARVPAICILGSIELDSQSINVSGVTKVDPTIT